jgi:hypothetical protein
MDPAGAMLAGQDLTCADPSGTTWIDKEECEDPSIADCGLPQANGCDKKCSGMFVTITNNSHYQLSCGISSGYSCHHGCQGVCLNPCSFVIVVSESSRGSALIPDKGSPAGNHLLHSCESSGAECMRYVDNSQDRGT